MAFNPFHAFRKHSKVVFAGLTILCMGTFVLSAGGGGFDFFQQLTTWVTGRGSRNDYVSLYGKSYTVQEFNDITYRRRMANDYMDTAIGIARQALNQRLKLTAQQIEADGNGPFTQALTMQDIYLTTPGIGRAQQVEMIQRIYQNNQFQIQQADVQKKTDLLNALGGLKRLLELDFTLLAGRQPKERFFGPTDSDKDTINFLIWRYQADQNGIRLTDTNISQMITEETRGELTDRDTDYIDKVLREQFKGIYNIEALYSALGDEFRVRMAQLALTGSMTGIGQGTVTASPTELTPQESWNLFKDARTTVKVAMIDVPVKDFIPKITARPSETDLKKLFDKYRGEEWAPDREQPGFKEPRKIQVEWIGASPDLPYYGKVADEVLAVAPALRLLGNTVPAAQMLTPVQLDAEALNQERSFRLKEPTWTSPLPQIHQTSSLRADVVASLVGSMLASAGTGAPAVTDGVFAMQTRIVTQEAKDRAVLGLGLIGLTASPDPLAVFGAPIAAMPEVKFEQIRKQLLDEAKSVLINGDKNAPQDRQGTMQYGLIATDLYALRGEVMKLNREKGKEAVEKYVADFVKERGLQHGKTDKPRDQYDLGDDPGLATLKDAYRKVNGQSDLLLRKFSNDFFSDLSQPGAPDGMFVPHSYFTTPTDNRQYLWWRTDDEPPKTPKFETAHKKVEDAWKLMQARDLAKKEAEHILEAVKKTPPREVANLRDVAEQNGKREFFDLQPMALYMPQFVPNSMGGVGRSYASAAQQPPLPADRLAQVYNIPADRIAYPDADMILNLLNLRKDPKGATTIVTDRPKQNFYVATLLSRDEPNPDDFRRAYQGSMSQATEGDPLLNYLRRNRPEEYRDAVLEQLKKAANVVMGEGARKRTAEQ